MDFIPFFPLSLSLSLPPPPTNSAMCTQLHYYYCVCVSDCTAQRLKETIKIITTTFYEIRWSRKLIIII